MQLLVVKYATHIQIHLHVAHWRQLNLDCNIPQQQWRELLHFAH